MLFLVSFLMQAACLSAVLPVITPHCSQQMLAVLLSGSFLLVANYCFVLFKPDALIMPLPARCTSLRSTQLKRIITIIEYEEKRNQLGKTCPNTSWHQNFDMVSARSVQYEAQSDAAIYRSLAGQITARLSAAHHSFPLESTPFCPPQRSRSSGCCYKTGTIVEPRPHKLATATVASPAMLHSQCSVLWPCLQS